MDHAGVKAQEGGYAKTECGGGTGADADYSYLLVLFTADHFGWEFISFVCLDAAYDTEY